MKVQTSDQRIEKVTISAIWTIVRGATPMPRVYVEKCFTKSVSVVYQKTKKSNDQLEWREPC